MSNSSNYTKDVVVFFDGRYKSIERKLRKKEIEKFELEEVAIKYNL